MGGTWEANIYINNERMTTIKVENSTPLSAIRAKCNNIIPKIDNYYFISTKNNILTDEGNYTAKEVFKKDGKDEYRIDLQTKEFLEDTGILVELILNDHNPVALKVKNNESLSTIKSKAFKDKPQDSIVFMTKDNALIENQNLFQFKLSDLIRFENGKKKSYYMIKIIIIEFRLLNI